MKGQVPELLHGTVASVNPLMVLLDGAQTPAGAYLSGAYGNPQVGDSISAAAFRGSILVLCKGLLPTATTGWQTFSYSNSWVSGGGPAAGTTAGYRLEGDVVRLAGSIHSGTSATVAFTLPVGYRPVTTVSPTANPYGAAGAAALTITSAGVATVFYSAGTGVDLDGMTFPVD